ncbi:MAG: hypothetical protein ACK5MD_09800 [Flavobacteriales bacterium]
MKLRILIILSFYLFINCKQSELTTLSTVPKPPTKKPLKSQPTYTYNIENHLKNYTKLISDIKKDKTYYKRQHDLNRVKKVLYTLLNDSIFPYWYGTPWNFHGSSEKPLTDSIACGYFVTTTLRDAGFPVQRISWAQEPSSVLINKICQPSSIKRFTDLNNLTKYLSTQPNKSIFILGLDHHVGFVIKENNTLFFTHSSYSGEKMVKKDLWDEAFPVMTSQSFLIGNILENKTLLKRWLK